MGEQTEVTHRSTGYSFNISIEREERITTGAKYPDRNVTTVKVGGHADTFKDCMSQLSQAKQEVEKLLEVSENEQSKTG